MSVDDRGGDGDNPANREKTQAHRPTSIRTTNENENTETNNKIWYTNTKKTIV